MDDHFVYCRLTSYRFLGSPWHRLYFLPEPQGQGALRGVPSSRATVEEVSPLSDGAV